MSDPLFSIVIPTYNRAPLLKVALDSVFYQKFTDYEVIVVDDGSTDGTLEMLKSYGDKIKVLTQQNSGPGTARNLGAGVAKGEYLAFLDSDDIWFPWTLETFSVLINKYRKPAIILAKEQEFLNNEIFFSDEQLSIESNCFPCFICASSTGYSFGAGMAVIRRWDFHNVGGFDVRFINAEDWDLVLRMGTALGFVRILSPVTLGYIRTPSSMTGNVLNSYIGSKLLISRETQGEYSGGLRYRYERLEILGRVIRPVALACLHKAMFKEAWDLYRLTFRWNVLLGRWKYILAFPLIAQKCFIFCRHN
jgi:glycosyltransferase involved in cell wall biosynthesis